MLWCADKSWWLGSIYLVNPFKISAGSICKSICFVLLTCLFLWGGSGQSHAAQVTLGWDAVPDPALAGYKLYYGYASQTYGPPVDVGNVTRYTLTGIQEGINCYFAVTAYDTSGNEGAHSEELECFTLVPAAVANGVISPDSAVVVSRGMSRSFTFAPAAGYSVTNVLVDGASVGAVSSYTFSNVTAAHTIAASFATTQPVTNAIFLWRNSTTGENVIWYMTGSKGTTLSSYANLPTVADPAWTIAGTADLDADGNPDILWRNASTGVNAIWYLCSANGLALSGYAYLPTVSDLAWTISGIADFNADGKPDILWRNALTGENTVWYLTGENGSTLSSYEYLPAVRDTAWNIVGTADLDGDGKPDILWRNAATGDNMVWYMTGENGSTLSSTEYLPAVTDQNWTVVGIN